MFMVEMTAFPAVPSETRKAAGRVFLPKNIYLQIGDRIGNIFEPVNLVQMDPLKRYNGDRLCRLALITAFQFAENLSDGNAAKALRSRIDWMYALHLPLNYPEFQPYTFCDFRLELMTHSDAECEFLKLLDSLNAEGLFNNTNTGRQPMPKRSPLSVTLLGWIGSGPPFKPHWKYYRLLLLNGCG